MIPVSLFSTEVPVDDKSAIAAKLLSLKPAVPVNVPDSRYGTGYGKPAFPDKVTASSSLSDFVTADSWFFFHSLNVPDDFLVMPVSEWPSLESCKKGMNNVKAINVVNDVAERGVKLSSDYLSSARSEEHYQNTIQVVEANRKEKPSLRK